MPADLHDMRTVSGYNLAKELYRNHTSIIKDLAPRLLARLGYLGRHLPPLSRMSGLDSGSTVVEFWELSVAVPDADREDDRQLLSTLERARADRYRFDADRNLFVACRASLRRILGQRMNIPPGEVPVATDPLGKPFVADLGFHFSVSHSSGKGLIAVSQEPVGIDVEPVRLMSDASAVAKRFFTSTEQTAILRFEEQDQISRRFLMCWTLKEALLKARGVGLSGSLTDFSVDIDRDPPQLTWEIERASDTGSDATDEAWTLAFLPVEDSYIGAVAVSASSVQLRPHRDVDR